MIFCIEQPIPLDPCFLTAGTIVSAELNSIPIPYQNSCCNVLTSDAEEKASERVSSCGSVRSCSWLHQSQAVHSGGRFYSSLSFFPCLCFCSQPHSSVRVQMTDVFILLYRWDSCRITFCQMNVNCWSMLSHTCCQQNTFKKLFQCTGHHFSWQSLRCILYC